LHILLSELLMGTEYRSKFYCYAINQSIQTSRVYAIGYSSSIMLKVERVHW